MSERKPEQGAELFRGMATIVLAGLVLGIAFNWLGLASKPVWGLPWVGQDKLSELESLETVAAAEAPSAGPSTYGGMDDPMAVPATAGLPEIPALDRPVQIELAAVKQLVDAGAAVLVDAREPDEFAAGRIPGALSMPYDEISSEPERLENLDARGLPIIVYCGGGACELSLSLAWDLIYAGQQKVVVFMGGYPEWEAAGFNVERGA